VTLTFGGNDVGFADVLKACVYDQYNVYGRPGCSRNSSLRDNVDKAINALAGGPAQTTGNGKPIHPLTEVLNDILSQAKNAHIYIADYPQLFGNVDALKSKACRVGTIEVSGSLFIQNDGVFIAKDDVRWLNQIGAKLNRTIQSAVAKLANPRITYVPVGPSFSGHRLCDRRTSWIHEVAGTAVVSGILHKLESLSVEPGSFHPTDDGQKAYETAFSSNLSSN
jgi:hypothetical protein